ncbi:putative rho-associated protein kinase 2, partial [Sesbania bispinosa]
GLAEKENNALQKKYDDVELQMNAESSYIEAKAKTDAAKVNLDKALKELEETKASF